MLMINTESGLTTLPEGKFPMADAPRLKIAGTAEPTFVPDDWEGTGCVYMSYDESSDREQFTWAVPEKGFVNITKDGEYLYNIDFLFEDPNGYTVSGGYSGIVDVYEPEPPIAREKSLREIRSSNHHFIPRWSRAAE
jgi:hypothetical protein